MYSIKNLIVISIFALSFSLLSAEEPKTLEISGEYKTEFVELKEHPDVEILEIYGITDHTHYISGNFHETNLDQLPGLSQLRLLSISTKRHSMYRYDYLTQKQFDAITSCANLEFLSLCARTHNLSFTPLTLYPKLETLWLHQNVTEEQLIDIGKMPHLRELFLRDFHMDNAEILHALENVESLDLGKADLTGDNIVQLAYVTLPNLKNLEAYGMAYDYKGKMIYERLNVKGINFAKLCPNLVELNIPISNAGGAEIKSLCANPTLEVIDISTSHITSGAVRNLSKIPTLKKINLSGTNIKGADFSCLSNLPQLEELDISVTNITRLDFETLATLTQLKTLDISALSSTTIREQDIQNLREALPDCQIIL